MGGERLCVLVGQIRRCVLAHFRGMSPISGSAIFTDVFGELAPSDVIEHPGSYSG
jgi:hypothetical protein